MAGRLATIGLFICSSLVVYLLDTAKDTFDIILQIGAGTGLLYLVRWFWWRVNAWCEVVAMISSFVSLSAAARAGEERLRDEHAPSAPHHDCRDDGHAGSRRPGSDRKPIERCSSSFTKRSGRRGAGWEPIRKAAGLPKTSASADNIPMALLGWTAGCASIWSALFTVGNVLYMRPMAAGVLFAVFVVSTLVLVNVTRKLWAQAE